MKEYSLEDVKSAYKDHQEEIEERIKEFKHLGDADNSRKFRELVFVILSSRSSAQEAWKAAKRLESNKMLQNGSEDEIASVLERFDISFERRKAGFIVENREELSQPSLKNPGADLKIGDRIDPERPDRTRENIVEWPGLGWKGASHFLRNLGHGDGFGIISSHVSKALYQLDLKDSPEPPSNREEYLEDERKLKELSRRTGIDNAELDLAIWASKTGEVFR